MRGAGLPVVVEVHEDVAPLPQAPTEHSGPAPERLRGVAAGVELLVPVQAGVDEVGRGLLDEGPPPGGVGRDHGHAAIAQQLQELRGLEGGVAGLHGVAQVPGERVQEIGQQRPVIAQRRGQLPQDGAQSGPQLAHARGPEALQRALRAAQAQQMRDVARALDREDEALGRRVGPAPEQRRALERVEGAVDLDAVELARGVLELAPMRQTGRVKIPPPTGVLPARDADPDVGKA